MSKIYWIPLMAAACWMVSAQPQQLDAPGVTVMMNGATVIHRAGVKYPAAALEAGAQGMVSVEVKLDSGGEVNDAQVLSGPDELRKAVLQSVLQWHFTKELAGTTRVIQVTFEPPKTPVEPAATSDLLPGVSGTRAKIQSIRVAGLSDQATRQLLATLPVHEGDEWNADSMQKASQAVQAFDEHLTIHTGMMMRSPTGDTQVGLVIEAPGTPAAVPPTAGVPGRIKVGGNVQAVAIIRKVPPVYPEQAKANGISGVVQLSAVIGPDGTVQELHVLGGPALLVQAAMDAVKQWVYRPTLLNNQPVAVETTIDINFTINQ